MRSSFTMGGWYVRVPSISPTPQPTHGGRKPRSLPRRLMGSLCLPARKYDQIGPARARRDEEEGRTLANLITTPQERLDAEQAEERARDAEIERDLVSTIDRLHLMTYRLDGEISRMEAQAGESKALADRLWAEYMAVARLDPHMTKLMNRYPTHAPEVPRHLASHYRSFARAEEFWQGRMSILTLLRTNQMFFSMHLDVLKAVRSAEEGAAITREIQRKFSAEDAQRLNLDLAGATDQLRRIVQEFSAMENRMALAEPGTGGDLGLGRVTMGIEHYRRFEQDVLPPPPEPLALPAPARIDVNRRRRPPAPPSVPATVLEAKEIPLA